MSLLVPVFLWKFISELSELFFSFGQIEFLVLVKLLNGLDGAQNHLQHVDFVFLAIDQNREFLFFDLKNTKKM